MPRWFVVHTRLDPVAAEQEYGGIECGGLPVNYHLSPIPLCVREIRNARHADNSARGAKLSKNASPPRRQRPSTPN